MLLITTTRKYSEHLRVTYQTTGLLFRPYYVSSAVYTVIPTPLEIKPASEICRAKSLPLSQQHASHTSDAKLTSHGNYVAN